MPNAPVLYRDMLSLALSWNIELYWRSLCSQTGVLLPSSHLISSGTRMEIQPVTQFISRSRCHPSEIQ